MTSAGPIERSMRARFERWYRELTSRAFEGGREATISEMSQSTWQNNEDLRRTFSCPSDLTEPRDRQTLSLERLRELCDSVLPSSFAIPDVVREQARFLTLHSEHLGRLSGHRVWGFRIDHQAEGDEALAAFNLPLRDVSRTPDELAAHVAEGLTLQPEVAPMTREESYDEWHARSTALIEDHRSRHE